MRMSLKRFYQVSAIVAFVIAGLLIGFFAWRYSTNQNALIEQEQAIQIVIQDLSIGLNARLSLMHGVESHYQHQFSRVQDEQEP